MGETTVEVEQEVFILLVKGGSPVPRRAVGKATVEKIEEDGTLLVSTPKGHKCPWKLKPDEVFCTEKEAEAALDAWLATFPSVRELFRRPDGAVC